MIDIKCRSPYIFIKPQTDKGAIYQVSATGSTASYSYIDKATGNIVNDTIPPYSNELTNCAEIGSITGASNSILSYCGGTYSSTVDFDTIKYSIKSWNGSILDVPTTVTYYKEKPKVVNSQESIYINLSNLVKEKLEGDVVNYMDLLSLAPNSLNEIGINESKWFNVEGDFYLNGTASGRTFSQTFFGIDGYIEPGESQSTNKNVLITTDKKTIVRNSNVKLHFKTESIESISFYSTLGWSVIYDFFPLPEPDLSNNYINSITIDTSQPTIYKFKYNVDGYYYDYYTTFEVYDECKYDKYNVIFKNKWGVLETITLTKKTTKTLSIDDESYLRSIVDYNGSYNIARHTKKHFNTNGYEEWTLNSDFIEESNNSSFKELMLSEEIWLCEPINITTFDKRTPYPIGSIVISGGEIWIAIANVPAAPPPAYPNDIPPMDPDRWQSYNPNDYYNSIIPINKSDTSITFKTNLNDKLIQYTMKVKLSHNTINNIQ